jgi:GNAT superfamily N-acetyltransferase
VTLRGEGLRSFWFKLLAEVGYRRLMLLELPLDKVVPEFSPTLPVAIEQLSESEFNDYFAFRPETRREDSVGRLRSGQRCFVARRDGRIVGAVWIAVQPLWLPYLGCAIDMAPGDVHAYDKFILPAYRGHGISNALRMQHLRHLQRVGHRRMIVAVLPENASSLRDVLKAGYRPCGMIGRIKLGPWQWHFRNAVTTSPGRVNTSCRRRPFGRGTSAACIQRRGTARAR